MKKICFLHNPVRIDGNLAGRKPKYIVLDRRSYEVVVYEGEEELPRLTGHLSRENLSELLQLSYVIPPNTVYEDVYTVNIGDSLTFSQENGNVRIIYDHKFPFLERFREKKSVCQSDFLEALYCAAQRQVAGEEPLLFHTAGKDSNAILASYLEAGCASSLILLSGASSGKSDESEISKSIAKKFGLRHVSIPILEKLDDTKLDYLKEQLALHPFPNLDAVMLPLCLYGYTGFDFEGKDCIFGDGNDGYFLSLPSRLESRLGPLTHLLSRFRKMKLPVSSGSRLGGLLRSKMEWSGVYGLSYYDVDQLFKGAINVFDRIVLDEGFREGLNPLEFKSDAYATRAISQRMMQKLALFCCANDANCVLPFADEEFVSTWGYLDAGRVADVNGGLNKVLLRNIVQDVVGIDTTAVGKKGWSFDYVKFVQEHRELILREVGRCGYWRPAISEWINHMCQARDSLTNSKIHACRSVYVVFMVSLWLCARHS